MGVDTKGCVVTDNKDVMLVCAIAEGALNQLVHSRRREVHPELHGFHKDVMANFASASTRLSPSTSVAQIHFKYLGEERTMNLNFSCDTDNRRLGPKSLSFSMGCSGRSEQYIKAVAQALSIFGPAHFDQNDCDDIPMAPLDLPRPSLLNLVAMGVVSPYAFEEHRDGGPSRVLKAYETFVGCTHAQAHQFDHIQDPSERWEFLKDFATEKTLASEHDFKLSTAKKTPSVSKMKP